MQIWENTRTCLGLHTFRNESVHNSTLHTCKLHQCKIFARTKRVAACLLHRHFLHCTRISKGREQEKRVYRNRSGLKNPHRMSDPNPILNNPYEEPKFYYGTDLDGRLDYENKRKGRRPFVPTVAPIPAGQRSPMGFITVVWFEFYKQPRSQRSRFILRCYEQGPVGATCL